MTAIRIYAVRCLPIRDAFKLEQWLHRISPEKRERFHRCRVRGEAFRMLYGEMLARLAVMERAGCKNDAIFFAKNAYGKPYVKGFPHIHFNLSHSGDWAVCASDVSPIGIDIERIKPVDMKIAQRFFAHEEYTWLMQTSPDRRLTAFYDLWTLKESYIKARGMGLSIPLDSFAIRKKEGSFYLDHGDQNVREQNIRFKQYEIDADYKLSVCAFHSSFPEKLRMLTFNDLERLFFDT